MLLSLLSTSRQSVENAKQLSITSSEGMSRFRNSKFPRFAVLHHAFSSLEERRLQVQ